MDIKLFAIAAIIIAAVMITGCTTNSQPTTAPTPTAQPIATVSTGNETASASPTPQPTQEEPKSSNSSTIPEILQENMKKLSPFFETYLDSAITDDFKKLATDTMAFRKEVQRQQDYFGDTPGSSEIPGADTLEGTDKILYTKYVGYLVTLNDMITQTQYSLMDINDDNNELTADEKLKYLTPAIDARYRAYDQLDSIFEFCDSNGCDCGENDPTIKLLKKNLF